MNPVVEAIGAMRFEGNIIPHVWYQTPLLKHDNGKPNMTAIILLSDILYWYRPIIERDEYTNEELPPRQRFSEHRLWKDYEEWGNQFGFSRRQVQDAIAFLTKNGLIEREIAMNNGYNNRVYLEPIVDAIRAISKPGKVADKPAKTADEIALRYNVRRPPSQRKAPPIETEDASPSNVTRPTSKGRQDTENTTKITHRQQQEPSPTASAADAVVVASAAALLCALQAEDIPVAVARKLLDLYGEEAIRQQLAWLPERQHDPEKGSRAGLLRKSIEEGWSAPAVKKPLPRPKVRTAVNRPSERPQETPEDVAARRSVIEDIRQKMRQGTGRSRG